MATDNELDLRVVCQCIEDGIYFSTRYAEYYADSGGIEAVDDDLGDRIFRHVEGNSVRNADQISPFRFHDSSLTVPECHFHNVFSRSSRPSLRPGFSCELSRQALVVITYDDKDIR